MRLILVRHGQTEWNRLRRIQGISDQGLNETGLKQAEAIAEALKDTNVAAIYTSPLQRARDTALAIGRYTPSREREKRGDIELFKVFNPVGGQA